jgi:hypothetical protein
MRGAQHKRQQSVRDDAADWVAALTQILLENNGQFAASTLHREMDRLGLGELHARMQAVYGNGRLRHLVESFPDFLFLVDDKRRSSITFAEESNEIFDVDYADDCDLDDSFRPGSAYLNSNKGNKWASKPETDRRKVTIRCLSVCAHASVRVHIK